MKTILLIIEREFLTRVKKKSFLIMTFLTPLIFAGSIFAYVAVATTKDTEEQHITVIDKSGLLDGNLANTDVLKFTFKNNISVDNLKDEYLKNQEHITVLSIGALDSAKNPTEVAFYSDRQINMDMQQHVKGALEKRVEENKLKGYDIEGLDKILASIKTKIDIKTIKWTKEGKAQETNTFLTMMIAYVLSIIIYFFIFMFGNMVMRGVIEEKSNRIIEVIISSVRPFQLMIGKIVGVASVGLLQFILWVLLTVGLVQGVASIFGSKMQDAAANMSSMQGMGAVAENASEVTKAIDSINNALSTIPILTILVSFLLFFLGGYLLYASLFAAIGSAVENEAETQQLILPVTIPLMIGFVIMIHTFQYPNSSLSFWGSMIPFTSPMVMMARIPSGGVPIWQIAVSVAALFTMFLVIVWLSGKIYRVGILMYGKKATFKEMWKWMWYKA